MKLRTRQYLTRQRAIRDMIEFKDIQSFLMAGMQISRSRLVQKHILNTVLQFDAYSWERKYSKAS